MAVWARLDGESSDLTQADVETHVSTCTECRTALTEAARVHRGLGRVDYERLDVDLWSRLRPAIASSARHKQAYEGQALFGLTAVLVAWRLAQLLLDLPAPVLNSIVPLALVVFVLWRLAGDPFAIRVSAHQFRQESAL
jgi:hypothetical protein